MKLEPLEPENIHNALAYLGDTFDTDTAEITLDVTMPNGNLGEVTVTLDAHGKLSIHSQDLKVNIENLSKDEFDRALFVEGVTVSPCARTCNADETIWLSDGDSYISGKGMCDAFFIAHDERVGIALCMGDEKLRNVPKALIGEARSLIEDTLSPHNIKKLEALDKILSNPDQPPLETLGEELVSQLAGSKSTADQETSSDMGM